MIYFDDGKVVGIIIDIQPSSARMEIKIGGVMRGSSQVRFTSGKHAHLAPVTNQDIYDLSQLSQHIIIDYIALPFASSDQDIHQLRQLLGETGKNVRILAKIDSMYGIEKFQEIQKAADGVIFVRNELAWEFTAEKLTIAQKWAI